MSQQEEAQLGYDALNDASGTFESLQTAERIKASLGKMWDAAKEADATKRFKRRIERVEGDFDPKAIDPENGNMGAIVDKRVPVPTPVLETSEWRTVTDQEAGAAYHWSVSRPEGQPEASPLLTLETPVDARAGDFETAEASARAGVAVQGRRIQEYVAGDDGKLHGRSADYTVAGESYRIVPNTQRSWEATNNEVEFIQTNLAAAELIRGAEAEMTGIVAGAAAPELRPAA